MLVVSENGYGKKTDLSEYKLQTRGGKGTHTYKMSEATGNVAGIKVVSDDDDIILYNLGRRQSSDSTPAR